MSAQSLLGLLGFRTGIIGSAATLAFAFPLLDGSLTADANTSATRVGFYADRGAGSTSIVGNVLGLDVVRIDERGLIPNRGTAITNTFLGANAGNPSMAGLENTLLGRSAGNALTNGSVNTFVGAQAGTTALVGNHTTTYGCIFLGGLAGDTSTNGLIRAMVVGSTTYPIEDVVFGFGSQFAGSLAGTTLTLRASSVQGVDFGGMTLRLEGGRSTGTGNGGDIALGITVPTITGSILNPLSIRLLVRGATGSTVVGSDPTTDCAGLDVQTGIAAAVAVMVGSSLTLGKTQTWMGFAGTQAVAETVTLPTLANGQTTRSGKSYTVYAKSITAATGTRSNRSVIRNGADVISLCGLYTDTIYHRPWQRIDIQADAAGGTSWWEAHASDFDTTLSQSCSHIETFDRTIAASGYVATASGAASAVDQVNALSAQAFGIVRLNTGTAGGGTARIGLDAVPLEMPGAAGSGYRYRYTSRIFISTLSAALQRYTLRNGLRVTPSAIGDTDGCYFRYADNVIAGNWQCVTRNAGVETTTDSGVAATVGWRELRVEINNDPAITTLNVRFFVAESLVATHTTNLPAAGVNLGPSFTAIKSVGTTAREFLVDYFAITGIPLGVMV